jgi:hypothetical protein
MTDEQTTTSNPPVATKQGRVMFPRTAEVCDAIARFQDEHHQRRAAIKQLAPTEQRWQERAAEKIYSEQRGSHERAAPQVYADELLPRILGGEWRPSQANYSHLPGLGYASGGVSHNLFDHPLFFRRTGSRGRLTWRDAVMIGRPYGALQDDGAPAPDAVGAAQDLAELGGVGVWARRDLSAWCPPHSQLVIAAPGVSHLGPAAFGFQAVTMPPVTFPDEQLDILFAHAATLPENEEWYGFDDALIMPMRADGRFAAAVLVGAPEGHFRRGRRWQPLVVARTEHGIYSVHHRTAPSGHVPATIRFPDDLFQSATIYVDYYDRSPSLRREPTGFSFNHE